MSGYRLEQLGAIAGWTLVICAVLYFGLHVITR